MGEMGRREVAEMIKCWRGDEGATLVAARRTATLGRYKLYYYSFLCGFEMISSSDENPGIVEAAICYIPAKSRKTYEKMYGLLRK
jgi:hypothetical protein